VRPRPVDGAAEVEERRRADLLRTAVGGRPSVVLPCHIMQVMVWNVASVGSGVREPLRKRGACFVWYKCCLLFCPCMRKTSKVVEPVSVGDSTLLCLQ
jgi:hypothetical protein